jgi:MarR family transcriptional regulator, transcriptional regulator for hemolysin
MQVKNPPDGWDPAASASFWINQSSRKLQRIQEGRLRPLGFGMSQMPVLHALEDGAAMSQKELAQRARVEQPTMAEMLARMERDGVVQRAPNPNDGRGSLTSLTRRSLVRLPKAKAELMDVERVATAGFSPEEKALLMTLLQRVISNLETSAASP